MPNLFEKISSIFKPKDDEQDEIKTIAPAANIPAANIERKSTPISSGNGMITSAAQESANRANWENGSLSSLSDLRNVFTSAAQRAKAEQETAAGKKWSAPVPGEPVQFQQSASPYSDLFPEAAPRSVVAQPSTSNFRKESQAIKREDLGKYGRGNIDLTDRNTGLRDKDGNLMTVKSMSFGEDGKEILVPTIVRRNGKWVELSDDEAIDWYHKTGEYLGKFDSIEEANDYAKRLHQEQAKMYASDSNPYGDLLNNNGGGKSYADLLTGRTNYGDERFTPKEGGLAERAMANDRREGYDWRRGTDYEQRTALEYYKLLDDDEISKIYTDVEALFDGNETDNGEELRKIYADGHQKITKKLDDIASQYGKASPEYHAARLFFDHYERLGRNTFAEYTEDYAHELSTQLDDTIKQVYSGVISSDDFEEIAKKGEEKMKKSIGTKGKWMPKVENASTLQKKLFYYVYYTDGVDGLKDIYNRFLGDTLNYENAAADYASDIREDSRLRRLWEADWANMESAMAQTFGGIQQTFTNSESDPTDRTLAGDYTVSDSVDDLLEREIGQYIGDADLSQYGASAFNEMATILADEEWYKEAVAEATEYQKQLLGYIALANSSTEAAKDLWAAIKEYDEAIWQTAKGSNTIATKRASQEGALYREYLGATGEKKMGDKTAAQIVWDSAQTMRAQYPQMAANAVLTLLGAPGLGRVLGNAIMASSVYGNSYKESRDQGYAKGQSMGYSATQAVLEFGVGMLLDAAGSVPGMLTGGGLKVIENIASPYLRALATLGIRGFGEGAEEYIQEALENPIRNWWFDEQNEFEPFSEEAAYSFFLGAISAMLMSPGNTVAEVNSGKLSAQFGKALKLQKSTEKLIDTILNNPAGDTKEQKELYNKAKELANQIKNGKVKDTDINVGDMAKWYAQAGGDTSFLQNPSTVSYTKEQITYDDMVAGAKSVLVSMDADPELAYDIAKLATGQQISSEAQTKINESPAAKEVLAQLQGELDMSQKNNALTIAARATVISGALDKVVYNTLKNENPNKNVVSPATQYFYNEGGLDIKAAQAAGSVVDKVLNGEEVTRDEAKILDASKPGVRASLLKLLDIDMSEYATVDDVVKALNEKARNVAKVKDFQAGVKESVKTASRVTPIPRNTTQGGVNTNGNQSGLGSNREESGSRRGAEVTGAESSGTGSAQETRGLPQNQHRRGLQSRAGTGSASVNAEEGSVIPSDQLDTKQQSIERRLVELGAKIVRFVTGRDANCGWDAEEGKYVIEIRTDGQFTQEQYAAHEPVHLCIEALAPEYRKRILGFWKDAFGADFQKAFDGIRRLYERKGYLKGLDREEATYLIIAETLCMSKAAQSYSFFDFAPYKELAESFIDRYGLEAIAKGDITDPQVQEAFKNGRVNTEYYERQGFRTPGTETTDSDMEIDISDNKNYSADEPEFYQDIGIILPNGETASFTDNINGVHEDLFYQLNGIDVDDMNDLISQGGIRVKPNEGIEINGDTVLSPAQYSMLDKIIENFDGKEFSIDFNIDGVNAGSISFTGADIDPNKVYSYLRNYYSRRKTEAVNNARLNRYRAILGMPVKNMADAYQIAKFMMQMDSDNPELQEIIDVYESGRFSADEDILNPESENYLGPDIDARTLAQAQEDDIYRNQDTWFKNTEEIEEDEEALGKESTLEEDVLEAELDSLLAEIEELGDTDPERRSALWQKIQNMQESEFNKTKHVDTAEETKAAPKKSAPAEPKAETKKAQPKKSKPTPKPFSPAKQVAEAAAEEAAATPTPAAEEESPYAARIKDLQDRLEADPSVANDPAFQAEFAALTREMAERQAAVEGEVSEEAAKAFKPAAETQKEKTEEPKKEKTKVIPVAKAETKAEVKTEAPAANKPVILENDGTEYKKHNKNSTYWKDIGKAESIEIRRRRSDRDTFDVRITDRKGNTVAYEDVSPAALTKAFALATGDRETAKARAAEAMALASEPSLNWREFGNPKFDRKTNFVKKTDLYRGSDNYGRKVPAGMTEYMAKSAVRDEKGALINTYRLADTDGVHNAKLPGRLSMFTERPAPLNTLRGVKGAEAYGYENTSATEKIAGLLKQLSDKNLTAKQLEKIRSQIANIERTNREYTRGVTRLDPFRPGYESAKPNNIINGKSLLEAYLNIEKPKEIDAKGKGLDFVRSEVQKNIGNLGDNDGFKFTNVRVIPEGESLGGGNLDLDTVYVTTRNNQAKSTYNTNPTTADRMQFSADEFGDPVQELAETQGKGRSGKASKAPMENLTGSLAPKKDAMGFSISRDQFEYFKNSHYLKDGKLVKGIIPLFQGANRGFGKMSYNFKHARGLHAIFMSNELSTGRSYARNEQDLVDFLDYEEMIDKIGKVLGVDPASLPTIGELYYILEDEDDYFFEDQQKEAAEKILEMYNAVAEDIAPDIGKLSPDEDIERRISEEADIIYSYASDLLDLADALDDAATKANKGMVYGLKVIAARAELEKLFNDLSDITNDAMSYSPRAYQRAITTLNGARFRVRDLINSTAPEEIMNIVNKVLDLTGEIGTKHLKELESDVKAMAEGRALVGKDGSRYSLEDIFKYFPRSGVKALYANIKNPFVFDGTKPDGEPGFWKALDLSDNKDFVEWLKTVDLKERIGHDPDDRNPRRATTDMVAAWAEDAGYDSTIFHNIYDNDGYAPAGASDVYVVYKGNQVKSVNNRHPTEDERYNHSADEYVGEDTGFTDGSLEDTILKILRDKDADHATAALLEYLGNFLQTGEIPRTDTDRVREIFQPQISESHKQIMQERLDKYIDRYGKLEPGESPARDIAFPAKTDEGFVRRLYRTAAESKNTPDRAVPYIERELLQREGAAYERITDKAATAYADREMRKKGFDRVLAEWQGKIDQDPHKISKNDVAIGELLYIEAANANRMDIAMQVLAELAEVGTAAGQVVQAFRMLKNMPKSYQLYYFQRVVNRLNRQYSKRIDKGRMEEITLDKNLAKAVLDAKTDEEVEAAIDDLIQSIADQIPATMADKWNAWRYLAMLGNPKTHIRNLFGNAIFAPAKFMKNLIAAGLETSFIRDPSQRVTSFRGLLDRKGTADYRAFAAKDYKGIQKELQSGGKYNPSNEIDEKRTIFKSKALEWLRKKNGWALEAEDGKFLERHYINALSNFLATKNFDLSTVDTVEGRKILNAARQYAFIEAQKATYRDASQVATAINQLKRIPVFGTLVEGVLPFAKTPINILKRGVEYSPIGLLKTIALESGKLKNGEISANEYIDNLSAGLSGTAIVALGLYLASLGILKGGKNGDDKEDDFEKLQGYQDYSINLSIGGKQYNYTIDWAAPSALPLFVGAALFDELNEKNGFSANDLTNALTVIAEPVTQLSMLSGLNDTLKSAKWDDNPLSSVIMSMGSGYFSQALPTVMGQIARTIDPTRRTTYVDKNSDVPQSIQRWLQTNVMGKTPGLNSQRAEYIDAWGRTDTTASMGFRLFENMLSPGYINRIQTTPVDEELTRLSKETGNSVLMAPAEKSIEYNKETHNLTAEQYATYAKTRGEATFTMLNQLFNSMEYKTGMTDKERAKAVTYIKEYGNILGKQAVFPDYETDDDNWAEKCDGDMNRLMNMAMLKAQASAQEITAGNNSDFYSLIINSNWLDPTEQGFAIAQQFTTSSETAYVNKGGPTYVLNNERKQYMYKYFRSTFPAYYLDLVNSREWQSADIEKKLDMLSKLRKSVGNDSKKWLAQQLAEQGVPGDA